MLDTWMKRKQYETLCNILGPSINHHLIENDLIKDIFQIETSLEDTRRPKYAQNQMERNKRVRSIQSSVKNLEIMFNFF